MSGGLAYEEAGNEPPLLLLHAFPLDRRVWRAQLEGLGGGLRVLAPDLAGFGETGGAGHTSLRGHADDVASFLDALHIEQAVVAGLSMGGYIALELWRRHRHRVAGLTLADTRAGADDDEARKKRAALAAAVLEGGSVVAADALVPHLVGPSCPSAIVEEVREAVLRQPPVGIASALEAMAARPDSSGDLGGIDVPCLVVVGAHDAVTPLVDAEALRDGIPDATLAVIPHAGHLSPLEEPGAFNGALRDFLASLADRQQG